MRKTRRRGRRSPVRNWSPEFRAWLEAYDAGVRGDDLEALDVAAGLAGVRLRHEAQLAYEQRMRGGW